MVVSNLVFLFALHSFVVFTSSSAFIIPRRLSPNDIGSRLHDTRTGAISSLNPNAITVRDMLWHMTSYFSSMVDPSTERFYSLSRPQSGELVHQHCPIRDLGAAWDATTLLEFWSHQQEWIRTNQHQHSITIHRQRLQDAVYRTLQIYNSSYSSVFAGNENDDAAAAAAVALDSDILLEPPNVAHSAFCLLTSIGALRLSLFCQYDMTKFPPMDALTRGILSMQRQDGAFRIEFGSENVYRGIEFYPGEAMVALMEVYHLSASMPSILDDSTRQAILSAMKRAFHFYADFYHQGNVDTNYNIWQVQAFARLFYALHGNENEQDESSRNQATLVADYVLELCQNIVQSRSWKELARGPSFYPNLQTVEIACGLDAVAEGIRVALKVSQDTKAKLFWTHAENAVHFLKAVQDQVPPEVTGSGGLGYGGIQVLEQRLDVTGHAISALTKVFQVQNKWTSHSV